MKTTSTPPVLLAILACLAILSPQQAVAAISFTASSDGSVDMVLNDNFADAQTLSGVDGFIADISNAGATKEAGEPSHAGNSGGASLWFHPGVSLFGYFLKLERCLRPERP